MLNFLQQESVKRDWPALILRLALASILIFHGFMKVGIDGGTTWAGETFPTAVQVLVAWGELIGGLALLIGFLTRLAALGIAVIQVGALIFVAQTREFTHIYPQSAQKGFNFLAVGYEYNVALLAICFALMGLGSGVYSLNNLIRKVWNWNRTALTQAQPPKPAPEEKVPQPV